MKPPNHAFRRSILLLPLLAALPGLACTVSPPDRTGSTRSPILNGNPVPDGRSDARRVVQIETEDYGRDPRECSGVVVSNAWVLTAAHCVDNLSQWARIVITSVPGAPTVDRVVLQPSYAASASPPSIHKAVTLADLALLHLPNPIQVDPSGVGELPVTTWEPPTGTPLHCYGFGRTSPSGTSPQPLHDAFLDLAVYTTDDGTANGIPEGFTLYANASDQQLAEGDSGGPCFVPTSDSTVPGVLAGIDSSAVTDPEYGTIEYVQQTGLMYFYGWLGSVTSGEIQDVVATFGGNLGAPAGNVTWGPGGDGLNSPAQVCTGRSSCTDPATTVWLGDPYPGQAKDVVLSWRCGRWPGVFGAYLPASTSGGNVSASCPPQGLSGIQVQSAEYGANCGVVPVDDVNRLVAACDGRTTCSYPISAGRIGDPAPGCAKSYAVTFTCGTSGSLRSTTIGPEASEHTLTLSCALLRPWPF